MTHYDVFNGDADGICALHQLRLETPIDAVLVTGVKRDIGLLRNVPGRKGDSVTVLDIAMDANREALVALLERGVAVDYFDHHYAGAVPVHPGLRATIDASPDVCTGLLVDRHLNGRQRVWAIVAAFGDNLREVATALGTAIGLAPETLAQLRELGEVLAYNAYSDDERDLIIHPAALYRLLHGYADPLRFVQAEAIVGRLSDARRSDLALARAVKPDVTLARVRVLVLPDAAWSRRVRGAIGNELANARPDLAHAVLAPNAAGGYTVSVRAPLSRRAGADALCRQFGGGGRAAAAGIEHLPPAAIPQFMRSVERAFSE